MKALALAGAMACVAGASAASSVNINFTPLNAPEIASADKIFNAEVKRDQDVNGGLRGHDVFLRPGGDSAPTSSKGVSWGASGTEYDWFLEFDGSKAILTAAGATVEWDLGPVRWNGLSLDVKALWESGGAFLANMTSRLTIETVNGQDVSFLGTTAPLNFTATNANGGLGPIGQIITLDDFAAFSSIGGTFQFDFDFFDGTTGSPNSRLAFTLKGYDITPVPLPAAGWLLLGGLAALGFAARRRDKAAA